MEGGRAGRGGSELLRAGGREIDVVVAAGAGAVGIGDEDIEAAIGRRRGADRGEFQIDDLADEVRAVGVYFGEGEFVAFDGPGEFAGGFGIGGDARLAKAAGGIGGRGAFLFRGRGRGFGFGLLIERGLGERADAERGEDEEQGGLHFHGFAFWVV